MSYILSSYTYGRCSDLNISELHGATVFEHMLAISGGAGKILKILYFKISLWNERNHLNNICIGFSETDRLRLEHKLKYLAF